MRLNSRSALLMPGELLDMGNVPKFETNQIFIHELLLFLLRNR